MFHIPVAVQASLARPVEPNGRVRADVLFSTKRSVISAVHLAGTGHVRSVRDRSGQVTSGQLV